MTKTAQDLKFAVFLSTWLPDCSESCHLTHKIATPGSISLPLFTRNQSQKLNDVSIQWKDKFAASKFWNHNLAEKILGLCTRNVLPCHGFSLQKELEALLDHVALGLSDEKFKIQAGHHEFGLLCHLQNTGMVHYRVIYDELFADCLFLQIRQEA